MSDTNLSHGGRGKAVSRSSRCRGWLFCSVVVLTGCITPANTVFPTLSVSSPNAEANRYRQHDPFPENTSGPDTFNRPRSFVRPRDEPRQTIESQTLLGIPPGGGATRGPVLPPRSSAYPDAVPQ